MRFELGGDLVERLLHLRLVGRELGAVPADVLEVTLADLGADADRLELVVLVILVVDLLHHLVAVELEPRAGSRADCVSCRGAAAS